MFNKDVFKIINKYLSDQLSFNNFVTKIKTDNSLYEFLIKNKKIKNLITKIKQQEDYSFIDSLNLYTTIKKNFKKNKFKNHKGTLEKIYDFLVDNLPDWFDGYNINFLYKIFSDNNLNIIDSNCVIIYQNQISKYFKYDIYPPRFLTSFDWPEKNNIPLKFKESCETIENEIITIKYIFYEENDPDNLIEIIQKDYI